MRSDVRRMQIPFRSPLWRMFASAVTVLLLVPAAVRAQESDVALVSMRPVQGIFDAQPLVRDKRTVFELQITSTFPSDINAEVILSATDANGVRMLEYYPDDPHLAPSLSSARDSIAFFVSIHPGTQTYIWPPRFEKRDQLPTTQFDVLPPVAGRWCPTISVLPFPPGMTPGHDANDSNNAASACFMVKGTNPFRLLYLSLTTVHEQENKAAVPMCDQVSSMADRSQAFIRRTYPVTEFKPGTQFDRHQVSDSDLSFAKDVRCMNEIYPALAPLTEIDHAQLMMKLNTLAMMGGYAGIIAVVRNGFIGQNFNRAGGAVGLASIANPPVHSALVEVAQPGDLTAQELAHAYGWVPSGHPLECRSTTPTDLNHLCNFPAPGYSVEERNLIPNSVIDFMHPVPRGPRWISKPTYDFLLGQLKAAPDPKVIALRGVILGDGSGLFDPWYELDGHPDIPLNHPGRLTISYRDASGAEIGRTGLDPSFEATHLELASPVVAALSLKIPEVPGTSRIVIALSGTTLLERPVSANAPAVRLTSPNGGELRRPGDAVDVTWQASDQDPGDSLHNAVLLSDDNGQTWIPLAIDLTDNHFTFIMPPNVVSHSILLKVVASDGVKTAEDVSDGALSSTDDITPPTVTGIPDRPPDSPSGWYNHPVTLSWAGDDHSGTGVAACDAPTLYSGPDAASITLTGRCSDRAGNVGTGSFALKYDATAPSVTSSDQGRDIPLHGSGIVPTLRCDDATSGVLECRASVSYLDTSTVGPHSYTATAVDNAGNRSMLVVQYRVVYIFVGISPPSASVKVKEGSTYPVKFALRDAAGVAIGTAIGTIYLDGKPGVSSGGSTVGNTFRYDPKSQQYVFNLSLNGVALGDHLMTIRLNDGTDHSFTIQIVK